MPDFSKRKAYLIFKIISNYYDRNASEILDFRTQTREKRIYFLD
jgi:hypothetical protein